MTTPSLRLVFILPGPHSITRLCGVVTKQRAVTAHYRAPWTSRCGIRACVCVCVESGNTLTDDPRDGWWDWWLTQWPAGCKMQLNECVCVCRTVGEPALSSHSQTIWPINILCNITIATEYESHCWPCKGNVLASQRVQLGTFVARHSFPRTHFLLLLYGGKESR